MMKELQLHLSSMNQDRYFMISDKNESYQLMKNWILYLPGKNRYLIKGKIPTKSSGGSIVTNVFYISDGENHKVLNPEARTPFFISTLYDFLEYGKNCTIQELKHYDFFLLSMEDPDVIITDLDSSIQEYAVFKIELYTRREEIKKMYKKANHYILNQVLLDTRSQSAISRLGMYEYLSRYLCD